MLKHIFLIGALALPLISCSSKPVQDANYREPAAAEDQLEVAFQTVVQDVSSSAARRLNFLENLLNYNFRVEGEVEQYRSELNQAIAARRANPQSSWNIEASPTYQRLSRLRVLLDRQLEIATYIYRRLYQTATDTQLPEALRSRSERILNGVHGSIRALAPAEKLQVLDVIESFREVAREFQGASMPQKSDRLPASISTSWAEVEKAYAMYDKPDISKLYKKHYREIQKRGAQAVARNDIEFPAVAAVSDTTDRSPSAERYAPGTGTYGNIIGRSFPTGLYSLTYDDGPNTTSTVRLMELLKAHRDSVNTNGAPATMFWLTKMINANPSSVTKAKELGFPINSHSWSHANLPTLNSAGQQREINEAVTVAQQRVGNQPATGSSTFRFFRCPYGACYSPASPAVRQRIANMNMIHAYWTVDSLDWKYARNPAKTFELASKGMLASGKGVVLFHDIHDGSVEATRMLLNWIKQQNQAGRRIRLKTLEGAVDEYNGSVR